jgi:hypothetical protein
MKMRLLCEIKSSKRPFLLQLAVVVEILPMVQP